MAFPRSGTVDTQTFSGTKDFIFGRLNTTQSSNVGSADHLKFDTIDFSRGAVASAAGAASGGSVFLDTSTTYSATVGAASIGRISVRGGKLYKLECSPTYILFSAAGSVTLQWVDVTVNGSQVALGSPMLIDSVTNASHEATYGDLWTMYNPGGGQNDIFLLEVQIIGAPTNLTSFGSATKGQPSFMVETY